MSGARATRGCAASRALPGSLVTLMLITAMSILSATSMLPSAPALAVGPSATVRSQPARLGTNLAGVTYYDGVVPFADLMDQAGDWIPQRDGAPWGSGVLPRLRADGWPAELAAGQFVSAPLAEYRYPAGRYAVAWEGNGRFDINGVLFSGNAGAGEVALDGTSLVVLNLRDTDPANPLRSVSVRVPGEPATAVFRSAYLQSLSIYSAVRFMDWQRTNSTAADPSRSFSCASRVTPSWYSQGTAAGASVERMVALANVLHVDPWFTIPHEADPGWVGCHARIVAESLDTGLTPRYEFSNETWNPTFRAFHDLSDEARAHGLGGGDDYAGLQQRVGQRHAEAMTTVSAEFARVGRPVVRVLAGQAANAWVAETRLAEPGVAATVDEVAIAPYLGVPGANPFEADQAAVIARWSPAQLFSQLATAQDNEVDAWTSAHVALVTKFGKRLVAYEGGQHLAGDPAADALTELFTQANRSETMGAAYRNYLARWGAATGGALFMHYQDAGPYTRFGSWGALEWPEQGTSPKYQALADYAGTPVPAPLPAPIVESPATACTPTSAGATTPSAPTLTRSTGRNRSALVWFRVPRPDRCPVIRYEFSFRKGASGRWSSWRVPDESPTRSPVRVRGLTNGRAFQVRLRAVSAVGFGVASRSVRVWPHA